MAAGARLSPRSRARLAGFFQLMEGWTSSSGQVFLLGTLVVQGGAAATAHNILAHEGLHRLGFLTSIAAVGFHLAWALLMYQLLRVVNRTLASLALLVVVICCAMQALTGLLYLAPLLILQGGQPAGGLGAAQARALAFAFLKVNTAAFQIDLVFFGLWCILTGY
jgi:Domain of unknown function (DUF4386)